MTREEAINILHGIRADNLNFDDLYTKDKYDALEMAISALEQNESAEEWYKLLVEKLDEQEPCKDAISREAVILLFGRNEMLNYDEAWILRKVKALPSVTPSRQVIENIKADIEAARYGLINDGLDVALRIIDKHTEGRM